MRADAHDNLRCTMHASNTTYIHGQAGSGFDTVIIDEAGQAVETSALIPLALGCTQLYLIGDTKQLPATGT